MKKADILLYKKIKLTTLRAYFLQEKLSGLSKRKLSIIRTSNCPLKEPTFLQANFLFAEKKRFSCSTSKLLIT
jgi:hypothetical protein